VEAFRRLAPRFPDRSFDMALRPNRYEIPGIDEMASEFENVNVYRFPYPPTITLERLISESLCVVLPFRRLNIQPQLAIAESIASGAATICTDTQSAPELMDSNRGGILVPCENSEALVTAISGLLENQERAIEMGVEGVRYLDTNWNWTNYGEELTDVYQGVLGRSL
jgi:glycosyltransferase involved in cell wall biosynthesis